MTAAQPPCEFAFQFPGRDDVNVAVDRFVGGVHQHQSGVITFERARDFLRRPAPPEPGMHLLAQGRVRGEVAATTLAGAASRKRAPVGPLRAVAGRAAVAFEFQADRARTTVQPHRHGRLSLAGSQRGLQFDAFR